LDQLYQNTGIFLADKINIFLNFQIPELKSSQRSKITKRNHKNISTARQEVPSMKRDGRNKLAKRSKDPQH